MGKSCKVVVCGQASVGKTSILEQLLYGNHVVGSEMIETQEDIYVGSIETDRGVREQVRFYDTRGLRDGTELPRHCFSCTDGYVLVYSTDSRESFQRVELLKKEIDKSKDKKEPQSSEGFCPSSRSPLWSWATNVTFRSSGVWTRMWLSTGPSRRR
ncbi:NF-kappa-B inhibitor-interacting Ras-like protein 2 isoform X1 [Heterocephalus glaber]|uniref:NF-kappa-B inhibitor-interacting Ras-like protein 2 isoform X1 n=1 Tax=Heterocephalus glaber TaxID=10181 RepID=A0AAX6RF96_HETGA|nr:NF-kappa-B inhibitor-interacting Ras-like protein 2 isoform X1 [Heterocephalus glaber]